MVRYFIRHVPIPQRMATVTAMRRELKGQDVDVITDHNRDGCWATCRRGALRALTLSKASHIVWLDDDLKLCRDFHSAVLKLIELRPRSIMCLYANARLAGQIWETDGSGWIYCKGMWGCANIWPRHLLMDFIRWESRHINQTVATSSDDVRVAYWLKHRNIEVYNAIPSLVQHEGRFSTYHNRNVGNQRATVFVDDVAPSPLTLSYPVDTLHRHTSTQPNRFPGWLLSSSN
jgi:hypothetical protein